MHSWQLAAGALNPSSTPSPSISVADKELQDLPHSEFCTFRKLLPRHGWFLRWPTYLCEFTLNCRVPVLMHFGGMSLTTSSICFDTKAVGTTWISLTPVVF